MFDWFNQTCRVIQLFLGLLLLQFYALIEFLVLNIKSGPMLSESWLCFREGKIQRLLSLWIILPVSLWTC